MASPDRLDLRASAAPLAFACPASTRLPLLRLSEDSAVAQLGTAAHHVFRALAETGSIKWSEIPECAARHGVDANELRMLAGLAAKLWPSIRESFPEALTEVPIEVQITAGPTVVGISGHLDLLSTTGKVARAGDWKTGRVDYNYAHQMRAYAALLLIDDSELTEATVTVIWVRDGEIENYTMTRAGMLDWVNELDERVVDWDGVYHPGPHCRYCPRSHDCEARTAMVRRDVAALADPGALDLARMEPTQIIELHRRASLVARYAKRVQELIREHVIGAGGIAADGASLTVETTTRRELDTLKAWPVLEEAGFGDADYAACAEISISRAETIVAKKAGRGNGAAAVREFAERLEEAGAVARKSTSTIKEKRT